MKKWLVFLVCIFVLFGCTNVKQEDMGTENATEATDAAEENGEVKDPTQSETEEVTSNDTKASETETQVNDSKTEEAVALVIDPESLRGLASAKNMYIGAAIDMKYFKEKAYQDTLKNQFNMLVLENLMKWASMNPNREQFIFAGADIAVKFAKENQMAMRGHTLIWHQQLPLWLTEGTWSKEELLSIVDYYVENMVTHFKGSIDSWDVLNEIFEEDGSFRQSMWYKTTGEEYITHALVKAREMDPDAKLFINDYNVEFINAKSDGLYNLVKKLVEQGVPLDGVGFQSHFIHDQIDYDSLEKNIQRFTALGLEVQFTEIDLRIKAPVTDERLVEQGEAYKKLMEIALRNGVTAFVTWGISDLHTWVPGFFIGYASPLLYDNKYNPKAGVEGIKVALRE